MSGVELAETILAENLETQIVFVTAYDRYAISAFEQAAIDYLLKPLETSRLEKTVQRIRKGKSFFESVGKSAEEAAGRDAEQADEPIRIKLLGGVGAMNGRGDYLKWRTGKEKELFACLALHLHEFVHRDHILDKLWPEEPFHKAKVYLHTCVSYLRREFRQYGLVKAVVYEEEKYMLGSDLLESDYRQLKESLQAMKQASQLSTKELERVLSMYAGPLFMDEDYPWAEPEIRHLDQEIANLRMELLRRYESQGDDARLIKAARVYIQTWPYNEEAYRLLMSGHRRLGQHDEVHRVYRQLTDRFDELAIEPSELTKRLYADICSGRA